VTDSGTAERHSRLLEAWEEQQVGFMPQRERRFAAMLDALALALGDEFVALDIGCGPGSLARRILERFPRARVVAVDVDPLLLALGRSALSRFGARLSFVAADLRDPDWMAALEGLRADAVVSTTAIHWLMPEQQVALLRGLPGVLREGGVFLNGEGRGPDRGSSVLHGWAETRRDAIADVRQAKGTLSWDGWWEEAKADPDLAGFAEAHDALMADWSIPPDTSVALHLAALRDAGFREAGTIWQMFDDHVVAAVR